MPAFAWLTSDRRSVPRPRLAWGQAVILLLAVAGLASLPAIYQIAYDRETRALIQDAHATAQLQVAVLQSELDKQRSVPVILASDSDVVRAVTAPSPDRLLAISRKLERLQKETRSADIYMLDGTGSVLAASNYALPTSFVGSNYNFREYFTQAWKNGQAEQFALGTVSRRPGLYIAHRIDTAAGPVGVVVVKVEFDEMEASWHRAAATTVVANHTGEVLLTSAPGLRFHPFPRPAPDQIATTLPTAMADWHLSLLSSRAGAVKAARAAIIIAVLAEALAGIALFWIWRRRKAVAEHAAAEAAYRERLKHDVATRTRELSDTNDRLSKEIHERQQAEERLNVLQTDLIQANKLAQLGQITAGVAHEINQPLAAMRTFAENSLTLARNVAVPPLVAENLGNIVRLSERIGHITSELRAFSRKGRRTTEPVPLKETLNSAILLNRSRLRGNRVKLARETLDPRIKVIGGRVRLEQVLVNLLQNAFEAVENLPDPHVRICAALSPEWVEIRISDNGPGLSPEVLQNLFKPFVTTKESGLGLGLVIAHDIAREFGGTLSAENGTVGAVFTLKLRKVS